MKALGGGLDGLTALKPLTGAGVVPAHGPGQHDTAGLLFFHDEGRLQDGRADEELVVNEAERLFAGFFEVVEERSEDGVAGLFLLDEELVEVRAEAIAELDEAAGDLERLRAEDPRLLLLTVHDGVVAEDREEEPGFVPIAEELGRGVAAESTHIGTVEGLAGEGEIQRGGDAAFEVVIIAVIIPRPNRG